LSSGELTVIVQTVRLAASASLPQPTANKAIRRETLTHAVKDRRCSGIATIPPAGVLADGDC
jgi:hypothetical protein